MSMRKRLCIQPGFTTTSVGDVLASTATLIGGMIDAGAPFYLLEW
ncbi:hypothetical protein O9992_28415 [Vibrio lentus]|nr:hypothetical protein [Vibrio lentus]